MFGKGNVKSLMLGLVLTLVPLLASGEVPGNDDRVDAAEIEMGEVITGTLAEATLEEGEVVPSSGNSSVWYRWTAEGVGVRELRVTSVYAYANVVAYSLTEEGELRKLVEGAFRQSEEGGDPSSPLASLGVRFQVAEGEAFVFQLSRADDNHDPTFSLHLGPLVGGPVEDAFENASVLPSMVDGLAIELSRATLQVGEPEATLPASVWRRWTAPSSGYWQFSTDGFLGIHRLDLWEGDSLVDLSLVSPVSREPDRLGSGYILTPAGTQVVLAKQGQSYRVRVLANFDGEVSLTIKPATAGDFFTEPIDLGSQLTATHTRQLTTPITVEVGEPEAPGGTQWFLWQCPSEGVYEVHAEAPRAFGGFGWVQGLQPFVDIYQGVSFDSLSEVEIVPLGVVSFPKRFWMAEGERIRIRVGILPSSAIAFPLWLGGGTGFPTEITMTLKKVGQRPSNDDFGSATVLENEIGGSNVAATPDVDEEPPGQSGDTVWHRWLVPATGRYEFQFETQAPLTCEIFRGQELEELELVDLIVLSGQPSPRLERMRLEANKDETYHMRVRGSGYGHQGSYLLRVSQITAPENDDFVDAIFLGSEVPAQSSGDTIGGGLEAPLEGNLAYVRRSKMSSIWWKWVAPETGFYALKADGVLGLLEKEAGDGGRLSFGAERLNFRAEEGSEYHFRVAHPWGSERAVELALERATGLDHVSPDRAVDLGEKMRFRTQPQLSLPGRHLDRGQVENNRVWGRWTPNVTGWVSVTAEFLDEGEGGFWIYEATNTRSAIGRYGNARYGKLFEQDVSSRRALGKLGDRFRNLILVDPSLAPRKGNALIRVEAGKSYFLVGGVSQVSDGNEGARFVFEVEPAAAPPSLGHGDVTVRRRPDEGVLELTVAVESPNGFSYGSVRADNREVGFVSAHRIQGDGFSGIYRVMTSDTSVPTANEVSVSTVVTDRLGISSDWQRFSLPVEVISEVVTQIDTQGPVIDGVTDLPEVVLLEGDAVTLSFELAISDRGGSGFVEGEILSPKGASSSWGYFPEAEQAEVLAKFGVAERIRGDSEIGIYRVTVAIPAGSAVGSMRCRVVDALGNLGGFISYPNLGCQFCRGVGVESVVISPVFVPYLNLPLKVEQGEDLSGDPVEISAVEVNHEKDAEEFIVSVDLAHADGVAGGEVVLTDLNGVIVQTVMFSDEDRIEGTRLAGRYEVRVPVPVIDFGGTHWVSIQARSENDVRTTEKAVAPIELPDRLPSDRHLPQMTRFQISPVQVNLLAGPAEIIVSMAAWDDQAGLKAELIILDSEGEELAHEILLCELPSFDCTVTVELPELEKPLRSPIAGIAVRLTDSAGRIETYGTPSGSSWPGDVIPVLSLYESSVDRLDYWCECWLGAGVKVSDGEQNSDGDEWPDLLEFALGTDPLTPHLFDPLGVRAPQFSLMEGSSFLGGTLTTNSIRWGFEAAPWFVSNGERLQSENWELIAEESSDLKAWDELKSQSYLTDIFSVSPSSRFGISQSVSDENPAKWFRVRLQARE